MAIIFPKEPYIGIRYSVGDNIWTWDGEVWNLLPPSSATFDRIILNASTEPASPVEGEIRVADKDEWDISEGGTPELVVYLDGNWVTLSEAISGGDSGSTSVTVSGSEPSEPASGNLWFNTENGILYVYYDDGDSQQWVQPSSPTPDLSSYATQTFVNNKFGNFVLSGSTITTDDSSGISFTKAVDFSSSVTLDNIVVSGSNFATEDSSSITFTSPVTFNTDVTIDNDLSVNKVISAENFTGNLTGNVLGNVTGNIISSGANTFDSATINELYVLQEANLAKTYEYAHVVNGVTGTISFNDSADQIGTVFYLTSPADNFTANFANVDLTGNAKTLSYALIIDQGATARMPTAMQVNGASVTPKWQGGTGTPSGNANQVDVVSITILVNNNAVQQVIAALSTFA